MRSGAGTDAAVSLEFKGTKAFVGATRLENNPKNFQVCMHVLP